MSLKKVHGAVEDFLSSDTPEALSIKGAWGVGKTYFWNSFVKSASRDPKYKFQRYAYVSLFGISSLDELKFAIFEQTVNKSQIGERISLDNLKQNTLDLAKGLGRKASWLLQIITIPWLKNIGPLVHSAAFLSIKDMLICLDDFERKGDKLLAKDVLGMVLLLKEQRNCKVVLIFNDSNLDEKAKIDYKRFREKVIDVEVLFNPNAKEASSFVFLDDSDIHKCISDLSIQLDIRNIRILRKVEKAVKSVEKLLTPFEDEVFHQALQTLTLLAWCYYSDENEQTPSYEYIKKRHDIYILKENDKPPQEKQWDAILTNYGFGYINEFDLALAKVIETGYVDETLEDVLRNISGKNAWGKSDEEVLQAASENDFYQFFKKQEGRHLSSYIKTCLEIGASAEKAKRALFRIGKENNLNRIRVKRYGISTEANE